MSNTYFEIQTEDGSRLDLTAFSGKEGDKSIQVTINSMLVENEITGLAYIRLSKDQAEKLITGLIERVTGEITATGEEKFKICSPKD